ncbi:hypothetical protein WS78_23715 [Burkholderia savannae]|nr:hypothetical protein WS78_23715 [Burkholderia savannae]
MPRECSITSGSRRLKVVQASLAPVVERLSEASATPVDNAVPLLGAPPATAPPATALPARVQRETELSERAAHVALAAQRVSQSIPALSQAA